MQNRSHDQEPGDPEVAGNDGERTASAPSDGDPAQGGTQHGLRGGAGIGGVGGGATQASRHATRYVETSRGRLSYQELAPLLAERVAAVEVCIADEKYAGKPLDQHLVLTLHGDIVAELVPAIGGKWRQNDVRVGNHEPPSYLRVPELMREYALDLAARIDSIGDDYERLLETLAFAEGRLLSIHPFEDFNGRITRVFLSELLRRLNLPEIDPTPTEGEPTRRYLSALASADRREWRPLIAIWRERLDADDYFTNAFRAITNHEPMSWQSRLFRIHFLAGDLPSAVSIPTGLGKTAVMAIWLIALAWQLRERTAPALPRRLVYVVDRRAVVDQATRFAEDLRKNLAGNSEESRALRAALGLADGEQLPISTLRGQFVDNREWLEDPAKPAIIVGTVDMIGSRLLFEGYGVSRKMRPYHAGLLGADALVLLDEAHLVPPFEALLAEIAGNAKTYGAKQVELNALVPRFQLLPLSATARRQTASPFVLEKDDFDESNEPLAHQRLFARKHLTSAPLPEGQKLYETLAEQAWTLSGNGTKPVRIIVFCNKREDAEKVKTALDTKAKKTPAEGRIELFVGARRVRERTDAQKKLETLGFLAGESAERMQPSFLVATSAGEVGVDLDADHMACDFVAWERMVQRFGRVNRRGGNGRRAEVIVIDEKPKPKKPEQPTADEQMRIRVHQTIQQLFEKLREKGKTEIDVSPESLRQLSERAASDAPLAQLIADASSPAPLRPAINRALVDAWAMTSLPEHTGRPDVAPWLRGWVDDEPQTAVAWRKHLPLRESIRDYGNLTKKEIKDIEDYFEAAPLHASEILETETRRQVVPWLQKQTVALGGDWNPDDAVGMVLGNDGTLVHVLKLKDMPPAKGWKDDDKKKFEAVLFGTTLVMDARFGGLKDGLLHKDVNEANEAPQTTDDGSNWIPSDDGKPVIRFRVQERGTESDEADEATDNDWSESLHFDLQRNPDGEATRWLVVQKWRDTSNNENDRAAGRPQALAEHQSWTAERAKDIGKCLGLPKDYVCALRIAARLHDEGKRAQRWQRAFRAERDAKKLGITEPLAKTRGPINQQVLGGYRHEFGSLPYATGDADFEKLSPDMQDLVLHLIAAHHGYARPLIATDGCEDAPRSVPEERAREVALRYARLQKHWGPWGLAWWEALLRAADAQASKANDEREDA